MGIGYNASLNRLYLQTPALKHGGSYNMMGAHNTRVEMTGSASSPITVVRLT